MPGFYRPSIRQFIRLLLVISLSWVSTGYAWRVVDGLDVIRAVCCCPQARKTYHSAEADATASVQMDDESGCCDIVASTALNNGNSFLILRTEVLGFGISSWTAKKAERTCSAFSLNLHTAP